jgi:crotonobetainyl-CoA:carnitine CoA-transferase CaiB-like acyl-CoA transferase
VKQALAGLRVLDATQVMAGPFCTMLLGDLGADVLKVEPPGGDTTRSMAGGKAGESPGYWSVNRNKRGIVVDLKDPRGRKIFGALAARSDVLVENGRPGAMGGLGLGYEDLRKENPALVYASISGFGHTGPYAARGGFDLVAQGMSGLMSVTGEPGRPPAKCGVPVTDLAAGLLALQAILAAYVHRLRTGEGQHVDASLFEAGIALSVWESAQYFSGGGVPEPLGSAHRMFAPYEAVRCADGYITLGAASTGTWERLARAIGRPELLQRPEYAHATDRVKNHDRLAREIEEVTLTRPRAHWLALLESEGVPSGPIMDYAEVFDDPHVRARGTVAELEHPAGGHIRVVGPVVKLSETPPRVTRRSPLYGEHTAEVLRELGYADEEIRTLAADGVIALGPSGR